MRRLGVDVGGTFTDLIYLDDEGGVHVHKVPSTPADPSTATVQGALEPAGPPGRSPPGSTSSSTAPPWRRTSSSSTTAPRSAPHDEGLPGHHPHRAPQEAAQLVELPGPAVAAVPARAAAQPHACHRARHRAERGRGVPLDEDEVRDAVRTLKGGWSRGDRGLLPLLVPQPRARAAGQGDRGRGVPGGVPLGAARGLPQYREYEGFSTVVPERLRRAEGEPLRARPGRGDARARLRRRASSDDLGRRRDDCRERGREARLDTVLRAGGWSDRRHLGRPNGGHAERHLARRRRHVGRHRRRADGEVRMRHLLDTKVATTTR